MKKFWYNVTVSRFTNVWQYLCSKTMFLKKYVLPIDICLEHPYFCTHVYNVYGNHKVYMRKEECQNFSLLVAYGGVILNPLC